MVPPLAPQLTVPAVLLLLWQPRPCSAQFVAMLQKSDWGSKSRRHFLTREEEYTEGLRAALGIW